MCGLMQSLIESISPGNPEDISWICQQMRGEDKREVLAVRTNRDLVSFARDLSNLSKESWVVKWGQLPTAALGICDLGFGVVSCWMVATDDWKKVACTATKFIKYFLIPSLVKQGYWRGEVLSIAVNSENLKWLEFLGFRKLSVCDGMGTNGEDFYFCVCDFKER